MTDDEDDSIKDNDGNGINFYFQLLIKLFRNQCFINL